MKRLLIAAVVVLFLLSGCSNGISSISSNPTSVSSRENVKEVNVLVRNLMANSQQMDFQVEPSRTSWASEGLSQIREMAFAIIPTVKVTGKMSKQADLHKSGMAFFKWSDVSIYIDLKESAPEKNLYIESSYGIHKAEASKESIDKVIAFANGNLILK